MQTFLCPLAQTALQRRYDRLVVQSGFETHSQTVARHSGGVYGVRGICHEEVLDTGDYRILHHDLHFLIIAYSYEKF